MRSFYSFHFFDEASPMMIRNNPFSFAVCSAHALLFFAVGCGSGVEVPDLVPVTGKVLLKGQPLEGAVVSFESATSGMSTGATDAEGRFELTYTGTNKGAVVGKHTVRVSKMTGEAGDEMVPAKYNINSQLTEEVTQAGPNDFTIDLK